MIGNPAVLGGQVSSYRRACIEADGVVPEELALPLRVHLPVQHERDRLWKVAFAMRICRSAASAASAGKRGVTIAQSRKETDVGFAADSLLEGAGFEPSVPRSRKGDSVLAKAKRGRITEATRGGPK